MKFTLLIVIIALLATSQAFRVKNKLEAETTGPIDDLLDSVS